MSNMSLAEMFDRVMRHPDSMRGMNVEVTCRMLADEVRQVASAEYVVRLQEMEDYYLGQFLHTMTVLPGFAGRIRAGVQRFR